MTVPFPRRTLMGGLAGLAGTATVLHRARAAGLKVLVGAIDEDPPIINPGISSASTAYVAGAPTYSGLAWTDVNGNLHPDLAERWDVSAEGRIITFHLRSGVVWHDGKPFTARDAQYSLSELTAKLHPSAKGAYRALDGIDAPDERTVVIRMKAPAAAFLKVPTAIWPILPRHIWEGSDITRNPANKRPVGTGPFRIIEYNAGDSIRYVRNEHYHMPGQPGFDELILRIIPDASARVSAYENGDVDILFNNAVPATEIPRLLRVPGTELRTARMPGGAFMGIINSRSRPYGDTMVRRALAHAIDRAFIRANVLPGISEAMLGPLPPSSPLYDRTLVDYALDPALANKILDDAGYARDASGIRFPFRFLWAGGDIRVTKMGDVIAQNLAAVGIKTILRPLDRAALISIGYVRGEFDMIVDSYALGPDPDIGVERLYNSANILPLPFVNNCGYANPEVDRLFDLQRTQTDLAERRASYAQIQKMIWADVPTLPICAYSAPVVVRTSYVADSFTNWNTTGEDFARAKPRA